MARVPSTMLPLGTPAPPFALPDLDGKLLSSAEIAGAPGLLVMFLCPHCPFVKHLRKALADFGREYGRRGLAIVAINPNSVEESPEDSPEHMVQEAREAGYTFPYLHDGTQEVALAYRAACTPDFFLFDQDRRLVYRGQFDGSRPGNEVPATGSELRKAADAVLEGVPVPAEQQASLGCNIKWKPGREPDYFRR